METLSSHFLLAAFGRRAVPRLPCRKKKKKKKKKEKKREIEFFGFLTDVKESRAFYSFFFFNFITYLRVKGTLSSLKF